MPHQRRSDRRRHSHAGQRHRRDSPEVSSEDYEDYGSTPTASTASRSNMSGSTAASSTYASSDSPPYSATSTQWTHATLDRHHPPMWPPVYDRPSITIEYSHTYPLQGLYNVEDHVYDFRLSSPPWSSAPPLHPAFMTGWDFIPPPLTPVQPGGYNVWPGTSHGSHETPVQGSTQRQYQPHYGPSAFQDRGQNFNPPSASPPQSASSQSEALPPEREWLSKTYVDCLYTFSPLAGTLITLKHPGRNDLPPDHLPCTDGDLSDDLLNRWTAAWLCLPDPQTHGRTRAYLYIHAATSITSDRDNYMMTLTEAGFDRLHEWSQLPARSPSF